MKETRKCKSFETLKLITQSITFKIHALKLLSPVTTHLQKHLTPKVKSKLENMLKHIADGIDCNPSVNLTDLFIFVYGLIAGATNEENGFSVSLTGTEANKHGNVVSEKIVSPAEAFRTKSACSHLITAFALGVLQNRVKSMKLDSNDEQLCLTPLVRLPLPSLESQADKLKVTLLSIAQSSVSLGNPLMESCLKLLTVLLRSTKITLSSDQLHMLLQFPVFVDLERNPSFIALSLLKAIVNRKLVVHEIYDIVVQVAELMVTSRRTNSQEMQYQHPTGRESVLEMLHAILIKFPKGIVDEQSQTIFVHLVVCLANDQDNKVRSMSGAVIKLLIGRISQHSLNSILEYSMSWYLGEKQQLWGADTDLSDEATIPFWKAAYYSIAMLEKMLHQFRDLSFERDLEVWPVYFLFFSDVDSEPELPPPPPPDRTAPARAARVHRPDPPRPARANRGGRPPRR
ncbi:hypothetical protein V6N13_104546 [Hibiscus sabdariffa]